MWPIIIGGFSSFLGIFVFIEYIILKKVRVRSVIANKLFEMRNEIKHIVISEEMMFDKGYPSMFLALFWPKSSPPFYLKQIERLLTAGFEGKETLIEITYLRYQHKQLKQYLSSMVDNTESISVDMVRPYYLDRIGNITKDINKLYLDKHITDIIMTTAHNVFTNKGKAGILLYGSPGNGKTSIVKYLATHFKVPIRIISLCPDFDNYSLIRLFSRLTNNTIVLMEDFDNYFEQRKCILGSGNENIKFTFDAILNGIDGVYNNYEGVLFIMTVNNLDKVDTTLKDRPGRFLHVLSIDNPNEEIKKDIIGDWSNKIHGNFSLDKLFRIKEYKESGHSFEQVSKLIKST